MAPGLCVAHYLLTGSRPGVPGLMHGGRVGAHLCTVPSAARRCPCPACRRWSSAGTGRRRSPRLCRTPAPNDRDGGEISPVTPRHTLQSRLFWRCRRLQTPTLVLFFSSQSGEGHSQWAWPFTSMHEAPKLHTSSSHEVGASGPEGGFNLCGYKLETEARLYSLRQGILMVAAPLHVYFMFPTFTLLLG